MDLIEVLAATNRIPERINEVKPWLNSDQQELADLLLSNPTHIGSIFDVPDFPQLLNEHCTAQAWTLILHQWSIQIAKEQLGQAIIAVDRGKAIDDTLNVLSSLRAQYADAARAHVVHDFQELFEVASETLPEMDLGPFATEIGIWPVEVGNLIVLGARPGVGKTAAALRMALERAAGGYRTHYVSLEMTSQQLAARFRSLITESPLRGAYPNVDEDLFAELVADLKDQIIIHHFTGNLASLRDAVEPYVTDGDLLVIDHAQLIQVGNQSRTEAYGEVTRYLKGLSRMRNATTLLLSQLKRDADNAAPGLGDLSWSSSFEQDADIVALLYQEADGTTICKIAKSRQGDQGVTSLAYDWQYSRTLPNEYRPREYEQSMIGTD